MPQAVQMDFSRRQSDLVGKFLEPRIQILFAVIVAIDGYKNHVVKYPNCRPFPLSLRVLTLLVFPEQGEQ